MKYKWKLFWIIIGCCILGTIALSYIAYKSSPPSNSSTFIEVTKTLFLCFGGIGVILPLYINATNAIEARYDNKIENTFKLLQKWDDSHFLEARKLTRELKKEKFSTSDKDLISKIENDPDLKQSVILLFNYFDHVRFSFETDRINKDLFGSSLGLVITDIICRFDPYIQTIASDVGKKQLEQLKIYLKK